MSSIRHYVTYTLERRGAPPLVLPPMLPVKGMAAFMVREAIKTGSKLVTRTSSQRDWPVR